MSCRDDSNEWSNIEIGWEITKIMLFEVKIFTLIWNPDYLGALASPKWCIAL